MVGRVRGVTSCKQTSVGACASSSLIATCVRRVISSPLSPHGEGETSGSGHPSMFQLMIVNPAAQFNCWVWVLVSAARRGTQALRGNMQRVSRRAASKPRRQRAASKKHLYLSRSAGAFAAHSSRPSLACAFPSSPHAHHSARRSGGVQPTV
jgi:hypothetical protein